MKQTKSEHLKESGEEVNKGREQEQGGAVSIAQGTVEVDSHRGEDVLASHGCERGRGKEAA